MAYSTAENERRPPLCSLLPIQPGPQHLGTRRRHDRYETYFVLVDGLRTSDFLFRVQSAQSGSHLTWSGDHSTSGFFAANTHFDELTPASYEETHSNKTGGKWLESPSIRQTILDHILSRKPLEIPDYEKSCWISSTAYLDWAIWDIARQLATKGGKVKLAVLRMGSNRERREDEVRIHPSSLLGKWQNEDTLTNRETSRRAIEMARQQSFISREVLYYGRIFSESIDRIYNWTPNFLPFPLPPKFWGKQARIVPLKAHCWLARLSWDPLRDDFITARLKMQTRQGSDEWIYQNKSSADPRWPPLLLMGTLNAQRHPILEHSSSSIVPPPPAAVTVSTSQSHSDQPKRSKSKNKKNKTKNKIKSVNEPEETLISISIPTVQPLLDLDQHNYNSTDEQIEIPILQAEPIKYKGRTHVNRSPPVFVRAQSTREQIDSYPNEMKSIMNRLAIEQDISLDDLLST